VNGPVFVDVTKLTLEPLTRCRRILASPLAHQRKKRRNGTRSSILGDDATSIIIEMPANPTCGARMVSCFIRPDRRRAHRSGSSDGIFATERKTSAVNADNVYADRLP